MSPSQISFKSWLNDAHSKLYVLLSQEWLQQFERMIGFRVVFLQQQKNDGDISFILKGKKYY